MSTDGDMTAVEGWNIQLQHRLAEAIKLMDRVVTQVGKSLPPELLEDLYKYMDSDGSVAAITEAEVAQLFEGEQAIKSSHETEMRFRLDLYRWADVTFGTVEERGPIGPLRHLAIEVEEAAKKFEAGDLEGGLVELADCQMIFWDAIRRARVVDPVLLAACYQKLEVVKQRAYPKPAGDEPVEHIRPMVLHCPKCNLQHIDQLEASGVDWRTRPHKKHLCSGCGHIWKPFDFYTVGVEKPDDNSAV
jgi:hypothetical protein